MFRSFSEDMVEDGEVDIPSSGSSLHGLHDEREVVFENGFRFFCGRTRFDCDQSLAVGEAVFGRRFFVSIEKHLVSDEAGDGRACSIRGAAHFFFGFLLVAIDVSRSPLILAAVPFGDLFLGGT